MRPQPLLPIFFRAAGACLAAVSLCAPAACLRTAGVQRAFMALDGSGDRPRSEFFADTQAIFCDVVYSSGRTDLTIDARIRSTALWDEAAQAVLPADVVEAVGEAAGAQGVGNTQAFQWQPAPPPDAGASDQVPFPVGDFVCDVLLDGEVAESVPFTVRFPACPVPPVVAGVICAGWVQEGSACPDAQGTTCTCTGGTWQC